MKKITVLGAGMVGRTIAIDLAKHYAVTSVDLRASNLALLPAHIGKTQADLADQKKIRQVVAGADLVIGAVPGFMGFDMLSTVIAQKKNIVDISFFPEDPFALDKLAKANGVTAILDCGVAPGMDNVILGYHDQRMEIDNFICLVGGLPEKRTLPFQYKAPFSPIDVLEEYTRPARIVENGKVVTRPALSEAEEVQFEHIGTLESFNSDGLRSLVKTMKHIPNMKEKTLRYPGHAKLMEALRGMGLFDKAPVMVRGTSVVPLDVTAALLFPKWQYEQGEAEFTVMRVTVEGREKGRKKSYTYDLLDRYDMTTHTSSMARTTGYTCTAAAVMLLEGLYKRKGIIPPELLGKEEKCFRFMLAYLEERGIFYHCRIS
ncbi:MAG: saccharopine dehydrogenase NADP-binding domain-containing protein [Chitinophagales bacterium]|nr:saccharopine dehydrogenase NADP-binding domain-containing protein [Chitinophagales bacterium]